MGSARKDGKANDKKIEDLRQGLEKQKHELDALASRVESVLRGEDWIQAKLYDLNLSLAALARAQQDGDSGSEYLPITAGAAKPDYAKTVREVREVVRRALPHDARVIVVTKGDEALLDLYGRRTWHFPQGADGEYPWYYPPDGVAVIAHLEVLRVRGGQYLLFPEPALWWLEQYPQFSDHLRRHYPVIHQDEDVCVVFALDEKRSTPSVGGWRARLGELIDGCASETGSEPSILDWNSDLGLKERFPGHAVFEPPAEEEDTLPYLDGSVDIVVVASPSRVVLEEARRVAGYGVVTLFPLEETDDASASANGELEARVEVLTEAGKQAGLPSASIIIPTYDGVEHLRLCLVSLNETLPDPFNGEVIVVDDGSGEEMQALLGEWRVSRFNLQVVRNPRNRGFVASCNRGAGAAKSDFLIFLNDDTMPQPGWLQALLRTFREYPDVGAVGGRLLYQDGRLQEAGNVVFSDGSAANFGRGDFAVDAPLYNHLREVDYCSAALLATPRELFSEIGGFDKRFEPGYYEDTDYCFEVRKHGKRVYYQPASTIVHTEGGTGGTDLTAGAKRFQVVNKSKFERKWKQALKNQPEPRELDQRAWYELTQRGAES